MTGASEDVVKMESLCTIDGDINYDCHIMGNTTGLSWWWVSGKESTCQ